jgi:hypothetical protein
MWFRVSKAMIRGMAAIALAAFSCTLFYSFAAHDLSKFETSDERLWKEGRITEYWDGVQEGFETGDWSETNINDKPGVTIALLAGMNRDTVADPTNLESWKKSKGKYVYRVFKNDRIEPINQAFRYPVVVASTILLFVIVLLVFAWSRSLLVTTASAIFLGLNPLLVGISQMLNPDAIFWGSAFAAFVGFCFLTRSVSWRGGFVVPLVGVLFGFALLSKYTANLLLLFFLPLLVLPLAETDERDERKKLIRTQFIRLIFILPIAYGLYALLYPAVLFDGELFLERTILSEWMRPILWPVAILYGVLFLDAFAMKARLVSVLAGWIRKAMPVILRVTAGILLLLFLVVIGNAWTGTHVVPLDGLQTFIEKKDVSRSSYLDTSAFGDDPALIGFGRVLVAQASNFTFALPLSVAVVVLAGLTLLIVRGKTRYPTYVLTAIGLPFVFFGGGMIAGVFVNARYALFLQPVYAVLAGVFLLDFAELFSRNRFFRHFLPVWTLTAFAFLAILGMRDIMPHYFNYQSPLLPQQYSLANTWSYGMYEAAQWLNAQPDAKDLRVWSDRQAFCRYFVGKCIRSSDIDRSIVVPDYFVLTPRNVDIESNRFEWKHPAVAVHPAEYYYSDEIMNDPAWELRIGGRPSAAIKIIKGEEAGGYTP